MTKRGRLKAGNSTVRQGPDDAGTPAAASVVGRIGRGVRGLAVTVAAALFLAAVVWQSYRIYHAPPETREREVLRLFGLQSPDLKVDVFDEESSRPVAQKTKGGRSEVRGTPDTHYALRLANGGEEILVLVVFVDGKNIVGKAPRKKNLEENRPIALKQGTRIISGWLGMPEGDAGEFAFPSAAGGDRAGPGIEVILLGSLGKPESQGGQVMRGSEGDNGDPLSILPADVAVSIPADPQKKEIHFAYQ